MAGREQVAKRSRLGWIYLAGVAVVVGLIVLAGLGVRDQLLRQGRTETGKTLLALAQIKQGELQDWLRRIEVMNMRPIDGSLAQILDSRERDLMMLRERLEWLVSRSHEFRSAWLLDERGDPVVGLDERPFPALTREVLERVWSEQRTLVEDFYLDERGRAVLAAVTPLLLGSGDAARVAGALVIEIDPAHDLYPLLQRGQPTSMPLETFLARREGAAVRYLNPLAGAPDPLTLQIPRPEQDLLALKGAVTPGEVVDGVDYRGVAILGVVYELPEMGWILATKVDADAVHAMAMREFSAIAWRFGFVVVLLGLLSWAGIRHARVQGDLRQLSSDLKRARMEKQFDFFVHYAKDIVLLMSHGGDILEANEMATRVYGYTYDELIGMNVSQLRSPESRGEFAAQLSASDSPEGTTFTTLHQKKDGSVFPVEVSSGVFDHGGTKYRQSIIRDVSSREAAARALAHSEARFRGFFELAMVGLAQIAPDRRWLEVNPALCDILHLEREELLARDWTDLVHPEDREGEAALFGEILSGKRNDYHLTLRFVDAHGGITWGSVAMRALRDSAGTIDFLVLIVEDITFLKDREAQLGQALDDQIELNERLEETRNQLVQSEKMASIGQLAAGVAHEINNPVGFVSSNLGVLERYLAGLLAAVEHAREHFGSDRAFADCLSQLEFDYIREDAPALLEESKDGIARVRKIVQDLKDFSRVGESDWQWADLHQGLDSTLNIVWNEIKYTATLEKCYGDLPRILCLPSQLNQVFLNLLVNAAHAISGHGVITVSTGAEAEQVWVEIRDTGCGIAPEHMGKLFDPFFTTKPIGKGTGLGLSLAFSIVRKHGGRIDVQSDVGVGTSFRVVLPITPVAAPAVEAGISKHEEHT